jgi:hypothetical protein
MRVGVPGAAPAGVDARAQVWMRIWVRAGEDAGMGARAARAGMDARTGVDAEMGACSCGCGYGCGKNSIFCVNGVEYKADATIHRPCFAFAISPFSRAVLLDSIGSNLWQ